MTTIEEKLLKLKNLYTKKYIFYSSIYAPNDIRVMCYNKILNILIVYIIERNFLINNFNTIKNYNKIMSKCDLPTNTFNNLESAYFSFSSHTTFSFYIRLFCALESSIRLIYKECKIQKHENIEKFENLDNIMKYICKTVNIDDKYINLIWLLSNIRNVMHGFGAYHYKNKEREYNGERYSFSPPFINERYVKLDFILNFFEKDIIEMLDKIFLSSKICQISHIQDDIMPF